MAHLLNGSFAHWLICAFAHLLTSSPKPFPGSPQLLPPSRCWLKCASTRKPLSFSASAPPILLGGMPASGQQLRKLVNNVRKQHFNRLKQVSKETLPDTATRPQVDNFIMKIARKLVHKLSEDQGRLYNEDGEMSPGLRDDVC